MMILSLMDSEWGHSAVMAVGVFVLALILSLIGTAIGETAKHSSKALRIYFVFILGVIVSISVAMGMLSEATPEELETTNVVELYAMDDGTRTEGSFFLLAGNVSEDAVYWYYYKEDGGFKRDYISSRDRLIVEDDSTPRIETVRYEKSFLIFRHRYNKKVIYIPEGSIGNEYILDNEN